MWLSDYLQKRWGLFGLVGGTTLAGLYLFGGPDAKPKQRSSKAPPAKAASKVDPGAPKKLTAAAVRQYCTQRGVAAASPAQARSQAVPHPGFPAPRTAAPTLGPKARGLFPLERKLLGLGARRLAHAPLLHKLAQGFAERFHYFGHLAQNRNAARRYYRLQAERRKRKGRPPTPGSVDAMGKPKVPPTAIIRLKARGHRRSALRYYQELTATKTLAGYKGRPRALLEYASLLLAPLPQIQPNRRTPRKKKAAAGSLASRTQTAAIRVLHQLLEDHPTSLEAIEAMALLAHRTAALGQCSKVIFLLKKLSTHPLHRHSGARTALLRGLAHYLAGRCLLQRGTHAAAAKRLLAAATDARLAVRMGATSGNVLAREAAILWARAFGAAGELTGARVHLNRLGPKLAAVAKGVLAAQLLSEGQLRSCMTLCTPTQPAPTGAK